MASHQGLIQDQFTKQAVSFSKAMKDENALRLLVEFAGASSSDTVLDVAYGRGIVVCAVCFGCGSRNGNRSHARNDRTRPYPAEGKRLAKRHLGGCRYQSVAWRKRRPW